MKGFPNNHCDLCWHDVDEELPPVRENILLHFINVDIPTVLMGYMDGDDENGYAFYDATDELFLTRDMFVDAWMPMPEGVF